jgi:hypothetical protein
VICLFWCKCSDLWKYADSWVIPRQKTVDFVLFDVIITTSNQITDLTDSRQIWAGKMKMTTTTASFTRSTYGELRGLTPDGRCIVLGAMALVQSAANSGKLPTAYDTISFDKKRRADGGAIHHEIYDTNEIISRVLVCVRESEGTRYGVKTLSKNYFVVARHGRGIRVLPANKAVAAKAAKAAGNTIGGALNVVLGKCKLPVKPAAIRTGYKLLARTESGYASVWDGSEWALGQPRIEAASDDHTGGYYYYASLDAALLAASANDVFGRARATKQLAIVEVEASGRHYEHWAEATGTIKLCASKITPIREIGSTL